MENAEIETSWTPEKQPAVATYALEACDDVTGQPSESITPSPNAYVVRVRATTAVLDQIAADEVNFTILWREEIPEDVI